MRTNKSKNETIHYEDEYFIIEEFQSKWNRWVALGDKYYLNEHEFNDFSACGQCWQETGVHGTYNYDHAITYCNALNDALNNDKAFAEKMNKNGAGVTKFRISKCLKIYIKKPLTTELDIRQKIDEFLNADKKSDERMKTSLIAEIEKYENLKNMTQEDIEYVQLLKSIVKD